MLLSVHLSLCFPLFLISLTHIPGINIFLDGYVPTENLRFRDTSLVFKVAETATEEEVKKMCRYQYPSMKKSMGDFELQIIEGEFTDSEIMVMLGENGETGLRSESQVSYLSSYNSPCINSNNNVHRVR